MRVARRRLVVLLNALYDRGVESVTVEHPAAEIGELLRVRLEDDGRATVRFTAGAMAYRDDRETIPAKHGQPAYDDLPDAETYVRATVASGHVPLANHDDVLDFVERRGYADLDAGHDPVVLGLDANIMAWRLPEVLGVDSETGATDERDRRPTNGYALATGVREELDWHYKQYNTHELTAAFGDEFARLDDQPAGANREGFLGLFEYRRLRTERTVDVVECDTGDAAIVDAYAAFDRTGRKRVLLLSNDHGFVERSVDAGVPAQHVAYPVDLPREATGSWTQAADLLYYLAVLFGVLRLPKVTLYGVWNGKDGRHWRDEQLDLDCRSPAVQPRLERDLAILDATT
jgi:hypothetical protein